MTADTKSLAKRFRRSLHRVVVFKSADETCCWGKHFSGVLGEVLGYLESLPSVEQHPDSRFAFPGVDAIVEGSNKMRPKWGKKPVHKRRVEEALAYLKQLGIVCRVPDMVTDYDRAHHHGLLVSPHDHGCQRQGNRCEFVDGGLRDAFVSGIEGGRVVEVTRVKFYPRKGYQK